MTDTRTDLVVVGASVAAEALIRQLRDLDDLRNVVVVDADADMPYERPPLSKTYLVDPAETEIEVDWEGTTVTPGRVVHLDPALKQVMIEEPSSGTTTTVGYESLVIATGAMPVILPFAPEGVLHLRTKHDTEKIREAVRPGARVGIIGAGAIGSELATSLSKLGAHVKLFDMATGPLERLLAGKLSDEISAWFDELNIQYQWGVGITGITGAPGSWTLHLADADDEDFDVLISAVGVRPEVRWLESSGILSDGMLQCDATGLVHGPKGTVADVYGAGDVVTRRAEDGTLSRTESWSAAAEHGAHLAYHLAGKEVPVSETPYFWTDVAGKKVQVLGTISPEGTLEVEFEDPQRGAKLYRITNPETGAHSWIGINAPAKIAQLRFA